ncbi:cuticle collagen 34-like [Panicum virgatum]|uniref:cuticle collagen 34-like n=1 Tax=Panicum virgatum TaxID=38727 RepID=UPI0019D65389|nr:cuticle collagen 34-like [Panicum virgatum]
MGAAAGQRPCVLSCRRPAPPPPQGRTPSGGTPPLPQEDAMDLAPGRHCAPTPPLDPPAPGLDPASPSVGRARGPRCRQIQSGRAPRGGQSRRGGAGAGGRHGEARGCRGCDVCDGVEAEDKR